MDLFDQSVQGSSFESRGSFSEINVTPLVDVMLVMLVIFMVTAPFLQQGIEVKLPAAAQKDFTNGSSEDYVLTVGKDGEIYLNDVEIPLQHLEPKLRQLNTQHPIQAIFLRADNDVPYGTVICVIDQVKQAGITTMGMVTTPLTDE
ncbi:ExbD/TolR family protein [bacterium]|nr:ExbD/TolR family protein [candidate division CSSED10-310 bacterium]